jgi:hypothetical protein
MFKIGDRVIVNTKFHGWKPGTIVCERKELHTDVFSGGKSWLVAIPNHWTKQTLALEADIRNVS